MKKQSQAIKAFHCGNVFPMGQKCPTCGVVVNGFGNTSGIPYPVMQPKHTSHRKQPVQGWRPATIETVRSMMLTLLITAIVITVMLLQAQP